MVSYRDTQVLKKLLIHLLRPFFLQHSHCFLWSFSDCVSIVERSQQTGFSFSFALFCSITIIEVCREVGVKRSTENKQPSTFICFLSPSLSHTHAHTVSLSLSHSLTLSLSLAQTHYLYLPHSLSIPILSNAFSPTRLHSLFLALFMSYLS